MDLKNVYLKIIHKVPSYSCAEKKTSKKKIQKIMLENEYDEEAVEKISDDFCQGFGIAKAIILELIEKEVEKTT